MFNIKRLLRWVPVRIDALGGITFVAPDEVGKAVGSLTRNSLTEYLPLFVSYKIAINQIAKAESGYLLYNITDKTEPAKLAPWFTRWLWLNLEKSHGHSILQWQVRQEVRSNPTRLFTAMLIGLVVNLGMLLLAYVQADGYGVANACAMSLQVIVRAFVCELYRSDLDKECQNLRQVASTPLPEEGRKLTKKKLVLVLPDGRVTIFCVPAGLYELMIDRTTSSGSSRKPGLWIVQGLGWLAFGVQLVTTGPALLLTQIYAVALMIFASQATISGYGVQQKEEVGAWLSIRQCCAGADRLLETYVMLEPTPGEEDYMIQCNLLPARSDEGIWGTPDSSGKGLTVGAWQRKREKWDQDKAAGQWTTERELLWRGGLDPMTLDFVGYK